MLPPKGVHDNPQYPSWGRYSFILYAAKGIINIIYLGPNFSARSNGIELVLFINVAISLLFRASFQNHGRTKEEENIQCYTERLETISNPSRDNNQQKQLTHKAKHGSKDHVQKIIGVVTERTNAADLLRGNISGRAGHIWRKFGWVKVTATVELHKLF